VSTYVAPVTRAPITLSRAVGAAECADTIFQQPWWLDAVAPGRWEEVTVRRDGRTVARLPYVIRGRPGLRMLTQSTMTQTLGPSVARSEVDGGRALGQEHELLAELERKLPPARAFSQQFSPAVLNALPFLWAGYRIEVRYTYRLHDMRSTDVLWEGLRSNVRREVRKARKRVEVVEGLGVDRFHDVLSKTYARQGLAAPRSLAELERLDEACARHRAGTMLFAQDETGRVHAGAWVVWDGQAAYYLLAGGDPDLRTSGASSLLVWEAIMRSRPHAHVFDFHGSMLQPIERFFRAFGARQTPYLSVTRMNPALRAALEARSAWRRLAVRA
jgi:antitoxin (DNA-binding transcriptional repressor) of toxin-antitoxin stability system